jgi:hypothetical protein
MDVSILNISILVVSLINGAFVVFSKEIATRYPKLEWINRLKFRIPLAVLILVVPYFANSKKEEINREVALKEQQRRDSIHEAKQQNYSLRMQNELVEVLAKYGLKYDSTKKEIERIVSGSMKSLPDPEVTLSYSDGMKLDSVDSEYFHFSITLCDRIAPASNIKIQSYFVTEEDGKLFLHNNPYPNHYIFPFGESLGTNALFIYRIDIRRNNANKVFCLLKGTYTNIDGSKTYQVKTIFSYEIKDKRFGKPLSPFYDMVQTFLSGKGIL